MLGSVLHFEGDQLAAHFGHQVHLVVASAAPVREAHVLRVVAGEQVLEHGCLGGHAQRGGVFQDGLALEHHGGGDGGVGQIDLESGAQHVLAVAIGLQAVDQVRGFQQLDEVLRSGALDLQVGAQVHHVQQPAIVHAQVKEGVLQIQHPAHAEQRGHVALEHLVDDVLAQQALRLGDAVHLRGLREAAAHQVFVEVADVGAGGVRGAVEVCRGPVEQIAQAAQRGHGRQGDLLDLQIFVERQRGQPDGVPAAYAGFLAGFHQRHGRASEGNPPVLAEVHLVLDPGAQFLPVLADELRFVQEQVFQPIGLGLALTPGVDHGIDAGQLEDGVVEGRVEDVGGRNASAQQQVHRLQHQRGLADLTRAGKQHRPRCRRRRHPGVQFAKGRPQPCGQVGQGLTPPPGVELRQNADELIFGDFHEADLPKKRRSIQVHIN